MKKYENTADEKEEDILEKINEEQNIDIEEI